MKSRRRNVQENNQTILRRHSKSISTDEYSEPIPHDLIIEILSRLPAKSVARCRCVSKLWGSVLGRPDFTETYLTRSYSRPQVLFACAKDRKVFFFSSPQPQNPEEKSSLNIANYHMNFPVGRVSDIYSPMSGLVCIRDNRILKGMKTPSMVWEICNPSTGQSWMLPKMKSRKRTGAASFFGYDPTEKQFKVLSMIRDYKNGISTEHQVLILARSGKMSVRVIECGIPHYPGTHGICINGVLYYKALPNWFSEDSGIMCFDVRSETFSFVQVMEPVIRYEATLINYKGKLALVRWDSYIGEKDARFVMYVLQDSEKKEWSKHVYELDPLVKNAVAMLSFVGVTGANEIVLSPKYPSDPFYVFYYSLERKTMTRVEIQGMGAFKQLKVYTFVNHVEDVKLMQAHI